MSKTARGCWLRRRRTPDQHPAILPWLSGLPWYERAIIRPVAEIGSGVAAESHSADALGIHYKMRETPRAIPQRRMPSRSINDL
jgi:hypothetical protein